MLDIYTLIDRSFVCFILQGVQSPVPDPENDRNRRNARRRNAVKNRRMFDFEPRSYGCHGTVCFIQISAILTTRTKKIAKRDCDSGGFPLLLAPAKRSLTVCVF